MTSCAILIPARHASTRLPGKPLIELNGVPMIKRVYDKCRATGFDTYVLTDDQQIYNIIGPNCFIDREEYDNGTERCAGAIANFETLDEYNEFINVQGDMPDVTEHMIVKCRESLRYSDVATVYTEMPEALQNDPSSVKLIRHNNQCLWFGRGMTGYGDWHLGVYAYKRAALEYYPTFELTQEEEVEKLEQLRWLKNGRQIACSSVYFDGIEINEPKDVEQWHSKNSH